MLARTHKIHTKNVVKAREAPSVSITPNQTLEQTATRRENHDNVTTDNRPHAARAPAGRRSALSR